MTTENESFGLCATYPRLLVVPMSVDQATLRKAAKFRSKNRLVALCWINPENSAPLCRCAQPLTGIVGAQSDADRHDALCYPNINN